MTEMILADVARATDALTLDRTALVFGNRTTTYAELDARADKVASGLSALGATDQERIAILDHSSDQFYEVWLGAARANLVLAPLNIRLSAPEVAQILADCRPRVVFYGPTFSALIERIKPQLNFVEHFIAMGDEYASWRDDQPATPQQSTMLVTDDCFQVYTSGTTGLPKGVRLTSESIFTAPFSALATGGSSPYELVGRDDVVLLCLPNAHVAGSLLGIFGLAQGARVVAVGVFAPAEIAEVIDREQVTMTVMVPVMIRALIAAMAETGRSCKSLKKIMYGAAPMATSLLKEAMHALPHTGFAQIYGLTETSGPITYLTIDDHRQIASGNDDLALSCGTATEGTEIRIIDADGQPLPAGDVGEITCRTLQVMKGYWNRPDDTSAAIHDGWFHSGDMGYVDEKGYLYIYDRKRDMIITGGENVYPAEVENILYGHPAIAEAAVIGVPDEQWGEAVKAVVVLKPGTVLTAAELIAHARDKVAGFKIPKSVDFVENLPRNASGKVLRRLIREPYWKHRTRGVA
ncbi:long-chain-fatty-acid--CoA ligase [Pseudomonas aeruginosa]